MRVGPCTPWCTQDQVQAMPGCSEVPDDIAAEAAAAASEVLYGLSAQQFTGECGPVIVRPLARPPDIDTRAFGTYLTPNGYLASWGSATAYGMAAGGAATRYGGLAPPVVDLGVYPVRAIVTVWIDGTVIPANEYRLQDYRMLTRVRPTANATPTARWGWPTSQILDLPHTEVGTFAVELTYGQDPPVSGVRGCRVLAAEMAKASVGSDSRLPQRITSVSRQGVSMMVVDVMDFLREGMSGIYEVDLFIKWANPSGQRKRSLVWSPDIGRPRRMPSS